MDRKFGQSKILIVDQQKLLAELLASAMSLTGREARGFADLQLQYLEPGCDILIIDPNVRGLHGNFGLTHLRSKFPKLKIVFLHDHFSEQLPHGVTLCKADGLLTRTMSLEALIVLVNTIEGIELLKSAKQ